MMRQAGFGRAALGCLLLSTTLSIAAFATPALAGPAKTPPPSARSDRPAWVAGLDGWQDTARQSGRGPNLATGTMQPDRPGGSPGGQSTGQQQDQGQAQESGGRQTSGKQPGKKGQNKPGEKSFVHVNVVGDVMTSSTPVPGPLHGFGSVGVATADYLRGAFDGVPEDPEYVAGSLAGSVTYEFLRKPSHGLAGLTITGGTEVGLSNTPAADRGDLYEVNSYVGLAAQLQGGWMTGLTYSFFATPDIAGADPARELAAAVRYSGNNFVGQLGPQVKIVKPVDDGDGWLAQLSVKPSFRVAGLNAGPVQLSLPIAVGAGFAEYYGAGVPDDTGVYGSVGAYLSAPLGIPKHWGNWQVSAGVDASWRDDTIQAAGGPLDDAGDVAVTGIVTLSFVY